MPRNGAGTYMYHAQHMGVTITDDTDKTVQHSKQSSCHTDCNTHKYYIHFKSILPVI